jgi:hypothetical protein
MLLCCRVSSELIGRAGMWCQNIMATNYLSFYSPQALLAVGAFAAAAVAARSISAAGFHIPCPLTHPASPGGWPLPSQTEFDQYFAPRFTVTSTASIRHCLFPWLDALKEQVAAVSGARSWRACVCKGLGGRGGGGGMQPQLMSRPVDLLSTVVLSVWPYTFYRPCADGCRPANFSQGRDCIDGAASRGGLPGAPTAWRCGGAARWAAVWGAVVGI